MFRLFLLTFHGEPRNEHAFEHAHESPWTMTTPLVVLAALSVLAGGVLPNLAGWFEARVGSEIIAPFGNPSEALEHLRHLAHESHYLVMGLSIAMFLGGLGLAVLFFAPIGFFHGREVVRPGTLLGGLRYCLQNLWFIDRFYTWLALHLIHAGQVVCGLFDKVVIDGAVNFWGTACRYLTCVVGRVDYWGVDGSVRAVGEGTLWGGRKARGLQTGLLQEYVYASLLLFAGVLLISVLILVVR
jgi:NADH-quinone oxidoreductase subunit L